MKYRSLLTLSGAILAWTAATTSCGDEPPSPPSAAKPAKLKIGGSYSVVAEIVNETRDGSEKPVLRAGRFVIPAEASGVDLQYRYEDPALGYTSTKLRKSNLYSLTEGRYLHELESKQIVALPPGEYRFEIGGSPGAGGELTVTVVPGAPGTTSTVPPIPTDSTAPPPTKPDSSFNPPTTNLTPPNPPQDEETQGVISACTGAWSGSYTIENITGNAGGLGIVPGRRYIGVQMQPEEGGTISVSGTVWMPPGWSGKAGLGKLERKSIRFFVVGQPMARGALIIDFKGTVDSMADAMEGSLAGYLPNGDKTEEVFRGSWSMKRK